MAINGHQTVVKLERQGDVMIVTPLSERMEMVELPIVFEQVLQLCRSGKRLFIVDFSRVTWMTPSLPGILVDLTDRIGELGGKVRISGLAEQAKASLEIYKIHDRFPVFDTVDRALESFGDEGPRRRVVYAEW